MSDNGFVLMRHALGVHRYAHNGGSRFSKPYRNHFVAGGDHVPIWDDLVAHGFARRRSGSEITTRGTPVYHVTDAGKEAALAGLTFKRRWGYGTPLNGASADE